MKKLLIAVSLLWGTISSHNVPVIEIGDELPFPGLVLTHTNGKSHELASLKGENGLLIVFAANKCIAVKYWYERLIKAGKMAEENGINVVWINANSTQRAEGESLTDMQTFANENSLPFDYMLEPEFKLADKFNAKVTPTSYLFDKDNKLVYMGIVDNDMMNADQATEHYLHDAISQTIAKKEVTIPVKWGRGCRIPRP